MKGITNAVLMILLVVLLAIIGGASFGVVGAIVGFAAAIVTILIVNRANVLFALGLYRYAKGMHNEAYKLMQRAAATTKLSTSKTLLYAYMMVRDGELDRAEAVINKVTYLNRNNLTDANIIDADMSRAVICWKRDNIEEGIEILENLYNKNLRSTTLYGTLGYFYILNNQLSKGIEFNKEAYEYNSDNQVIMDNYACNCILCSYFEKAEEIYNRLLPLKPEFIEPYYNYAMLLEKRMQIREAIHYYKKALQYPEKYLSVITHSSINEAIERLQKHVVTLDRTNELDQHQSEPQPNNNTDGKSPDQTEQPSDADVAASEDI